MRRLALFACLLVLWSAPALAQIKVIASFSILADMAREIGGDRIALTILVGPDMDAHAYEPTPSDLRAIAQADLVLMNGLGFEPWLDRLVLASGFRGPIVAAGEGIKLRLMEEEHDHGNGKADRHKVPDPHGWQSLVNARIYIRNIGEALARLDPDGADQYGAAAGAYEKQIIEADGWVRRELTKVPIAKRKVISSHDSFGYFSDAYGVKFLSPVGVSTEREPSARDIARLITQIRRDGVKALFVENIADRGLMARLVGEAGGTIGGKLYSDALSAANGPAPTYIKLFQHNVSALVAAMAKN